VRQVCFLRKTTNHPGFNARGVEAAWRRFLKRERLPGVLLPLGRGSQERFGTALLIFLTSTERTTMTNDDQKGKEPAKLLPTKPHSIYAWFVGLPLGVLIVLSALTILLWKVAIPAYVLHIEEQEAEKAAQERKAEQEKVVELIGVEQKRLDKQLTLAEKQALRAHELEKERLQEETRRAKEKAEQERKNREEFLRLQAEEEKQKAKERAEELKRQTEREESESRREAEIEAERNRLQDIEDDHKAIMAYMKVNMPTQNSRTNFIWELPVRAVTVKVNAGMGIFGPLGEKLTDGDDFASKQGKLYRLQGKLSSGGILGANEKPVPKTFSYYFLISDGQVIRWQEASSDKTLTMCKVLKELKVEDNGRAVAPSKREKQPIRERRAELGDILTFDGKTFISTEVERFAPVTLELWVRPEKPTAQEPGQYVIGSDIPGHSGIGILLRYESGNDSPLISAQFLPSSGHNEISSNARLPLKEWSHLAAVFGMSQTTIYLNGKEIGRGPPSLNNGGTPFVLGKAGKDNPRHSFTGKIRAVRISKGERYFKEFIPPVSLEKDEATVFIRNAKGIR
jgi:hypothetical protein